MARGKKLTTEEKIEQLKKEINEKTKELKKLEELKKQEDLQEIRELVKESGLNIDEIKELLSSNKK